MYRSISRPASGRVAVNQWTQLTLTRRDATISQQNARRKAQQYLNYTAFSRQGLIEQLVYEGFSVDDATFGVDSITVDWNQQAAKKAQQYLNYTSFSRQGLLEQLQYEGFTPSQAAYGVAAAYQ